MKIKKIFSVILLAIFMTSTKLFSATYFVSVSGSDSTGNGSSTSPWATIGKGCKSILSGDTLVIKDGTYTGSSNMFTFSNGNYPPSGTTNNYTKVMAENVGQAIIDGQGLNIPFNGHDSDWLWVDGIVFANSSDSVFSLQGNSSNFCSYIKVTRCGFCDANSRNGNPRCDNFSFRYAEYVLVEDCYSWGNGKYRFYALDSRKVVFRRCVDRYDRSYGDASYSNSASFRVYGSSLTYLQNCISIDCNQSANILNDGGGLGYPYAFFLGWNPSTGFSCNNNHIAGCMAVNNTARMGFLLAGDDNHIFGNDIKNTVAWNLYSGIYYRQNNVLNVDNCIVGHTSSPNGFLISCDYSNILTASGTILCGSIYKANRNCSSDYNCYWANVSADFEGASAGVHDYCQNNSNSFDPIYASTNLGGGIKYLPRVEIGSNLSGKGSGGDIGASIIYQIGTTGTMYGDEGFDTPTTDSLWPFPNEDLIKGKMKAYSFTDSNGTVSGKRGFCADGKQLDGVSDITLTSYIWEYLGNKMPTGIYPAGVTITAPSNLAAVSASSSTVTLTWKDNSSAETGFNIERKTGALGVYVTVAVPAANATTCTDTGLTFGTTYYYRARAYNASAYSAYSNEVSVVAGNLPFVPVVAQMDVKIIGAKDGQGIVNPDKGDTAQIQFQGNTQGNYECRIFLPTGEQVWYDRKDNVSQGVFVWSPKNMASGTYFAAIIGPGLKVKKKIVVVR